MPRNKAEINLYSHYVEAYVKAFTGHEFNRNDFGRRKMEGHTVSFLLEEKLAVAQGVFDAKSGNKMSEFSDFIKNKSKA
jgi:hypothetical protein